MSANPHARAAKAYLEELCSIIDQKHRLMRPRRQWWASPVIMPAAAIGLAAGLVGCGGSVETEPDPGEVCGDKLDNDGDGKIDCADPDCNCSTPVYSAPGPDAGTPNDSGPKPDVLSKENCTDNVDNDGDGLTDCADSDCAGQCSAPAYMAPPVEICNDQADNDWDGKIDCADEDCAMEPICSAEYAAPVEICNDQADNDYDGKIDCLDDDCVGSQYCGGEDYAAPFEVCDDKKDNDYDGKIDCLDPDCQYDPVCMQAAYAAPGK